MWKHLECVSGVGLVAEGLVILRLHPSESEGAQPWLSHVISPPCSCPFCIPRGTPGCSSFLQLLRSSPVLEETGRATCTAVSVTCHVLWPSRGGGAGALHLCLLRGDTAVLLTRGRVKRGRLGSCPGKSEQGTECHRISLNAGAYSLGFHTRLLVSLAK